MYIPNALVIENTMVNRLPILLLILAVIFILYTITSIELQNIRVEKLKEIIKLIEEGHARKVKDKRV